jgi:hypothetical protein
VILSAIVPTFIATTFFEPQEQGPEEDEEIESADEIDARPMYRRRTQPRAS